MKKHFKLIDLDCANCAAKMEAAIKKLDGVHDATVSFMTQKLTLDADDTRFDEILNEVVKVCEDGARLYHRPRGPPGTYGGVPDLRKGRCPVIPASRCSSASLASAIAAVAFSCRRRGDGCGCSPF